MVSQSIIDPVKSLFLVFLKRILRVFDIGQSDSIEAYLVRSEPTKCRLKDEGLQILAKAQTNFRIYDSHLSNKVICLMDNLKKNTILYKIVISETYICIYVSGYIYLSKIWHNLVASSFINHYPFQNSILCSILCLETTFQPI